MQADKIMQLLSGRPAGADPGPIDRGFGRRRHREDLVRLLMRERSSVAALHGNRSTVFRSARPR